MTRDFDEEIKQYLTNRAKLNRNYNPKDIPITNGIYIVECPDGVEPEFMDETIAIKTRKIKKGIHKGELKPTEEHSAEELKLKYDNGNKKILYIGKGEGEEGIKSRISKLLKRGFKKKEQHQGGKELWQIKNIEDMNIYWYPIENAREIEKELLILHKEKYTVYPVANWQE